jgi:hypothetical protein
MSNLMLEYSIWQCYMAKHGWLKLRTLYPRRRAFSINRIGNLVGPRGVMVKLCYSSVPKANRIPTGRVGLHFTGRDSWPQKMSPLLHLSSATRADIVPAGGPSAFTSSDTQLPLVIHVNSSSVWIVVTYKCGYRPVLSGYWLLWQRRREGRSSGSLQFSKMSILLRCDTFISSN